TEQAMERDQDRKRVWLLGYDLLISSASDVSRIPAKGKNLVVVAAVKDGLHFRFFDGQGRVVVDTNEQRLAEQAGKIKELKHHLAKKNLWPPHQLAGAEKGPVVTAVASIVGQSVLLKKSDVASKSGSNNVGVTTCIAIPHYVTTGAARDGL